MLLMFKSIPLFFGNIVDESPFEICDDGEVSKMPKKPLMCLIV